MIWEARGRKFHLNTVIHILSFELKQNVTLVMQRRGNNSKLTDSVPRVSSTTPSDEPVRMDMWKAGRESRKGRLCPVFQQKMPLNTYLLMVRIRQGNVRAGVRRRPAEEGRAKVVAGKDLRVRENSNALYTNGAETDKRKTEGAATRGRWCVAAYTDDDNRTRGLPEQRQPK